MSVRHTVLEPASRSCYIQPPECSSLQLYAYDIATLRAIEMSLPQMFGLRMFAVNKSNLLQEQKGQVKIPTEWKRLIRSSAAVGRTVGSSCRSVWDWSNCPHGWKGLIKLCSGMGGISQTVCRGEKVQLFIKSWA